MGERVIRTCDQCGKDLAGPNAFTISPPGRRATVVIELCEEHALLLNQMITLGRTVRPRRKSGADAIEAARERQS